MFLSIARKFGRNSDLTVDISSQRQKTAVFTGNSASQQRWPHSALKGEASAQLRVAVGRLDLAIQQTYLSNNNSNPGPSGEDVNLAMSDQVFRAKVHGSADIRAQVFLISLI
jgi:hypothetical protein